MEIQQWCERVFEIWMVKDLKKESFFLFGFFLEAERQREKSKVVITRIDELSLLGVNFLCVGLNKRLGFCFFKYKTEEKILNSTCKNSE